MNERFQALVYGVALALIIGWVLYIGKVVFVPSPFAILVSLAVWSGLWGIPGAFLAVPITAFMVIVFSEFAGTRPLAVLLSRNGRL